MSNLQLAPSQITVAYITNKAIDEIKKETGFEVEILVLNIRKKRDVKLDEAMDLIEQCCQCWNVKKEEVCNGSKKRHIVAMRSLIQHFLKTTTQTTLQNIGLLVGGFHHTTVIHNVENVKHFLANNDHLVNKYFEPIKHLYAPIEI
jgi:chromosomal replication initiation ATPase DnaA